MKVKEAMHKGVQWMEPTASLIELARVMKEHDIGAIPIGENDRLIGMVTDRDLAVNGIASGREIQTLSERDVMTRDIIYCRDNEELDDALRIMESRQVRRLPVINEDKRMVGMLSLGDVSQAASHELTGELAASVSDHH